MAAITFWIAFHAPDIDEMYLDPDDLEDNAVQPELEAFMETVAQSIRERDWSPRDWGVQYYDDRPPQ
jgi:hypothetical protein